ncbi:ABC transporter permease [Citricoccus sp. GCM10030269]|uniref:PH-like domain-containing protein n=1 Tax=Citricoccus sp. GCM10030269 TaxID=3273388 RepID=UPI003609AC63
MNDVIVQYALIGIATVAVVVLIVFLMRRGWRARQARQQDVAAPAPVPTGILETEPVAASDGMYVNTVTTRNYLDRIAVHGLGLRTNARLEVHTIGVALLRDGSPNIFIPAADLVEAGLDSGMSGKFVEKDGLVVITWRLGGREVRTGFRTRASHDRDPLLEALESLVDRQTPHHPQNPQNPQMEKFS